jgi:DNA-binding GntR family transcriptional regulator
VDLDEMNPKIDDDIDESVIVDRIYNAVIEQRIPPGAKLSEASLCSMFGVGRMRARRSLLLLSNSGVVKLENNRGAHVAQPTSEEALAVFEARRAIEPNIARLAAQKNVEEDLQELSKHLKQEELAAQAGNRQSAIRLSGLFHTKLAEVAKNMVMARMVKELVARTSLIIGIYGAPGTKNCHDDEHLMILDALKNHDEDLAASLMEKHLMHIEQQVDLSRRSRTSFNLVEALMS